MLRLAVLGRLTIAGSGFFGAALLARVLDSSDNGKLFYLLGVLSVSMTLGGLGLNNYLVSKLNIGSKGEVADIARLALIAAPVISFLTAAIVLSFSGVELGFLGLAVAALMAATISGQIVLGEIFRALGNYGRFQLVSNGNYVISIPATGIAGTAIGLSVLVVVYIFDIKYGLLQLLVTSLGTSFVVLFFLTHYLFKAMPYDTIRIGFAEFIKVLDEVKFYFLVSLSLSFFAFIDVFLLKFFSQSDSIIASYMLSLRLVILLHIPQIFLVSYFQAKIAKLYFEGNFSSARFLCLRITKYIFPMAGLMFFVYFFEGDFLLKFAFGEEYVNGYDVLVIRSVGYMATVFFGISGGAMLAIGCAKEVAYILLTSIVITIVAVVCLLAIGAFSAVVVIAISVTLGQIFQAVLQWNIAKQKFIGGLDFFSSWQTKHSHF